MSPGKQMTPSLRSTVLMIGLGVGMGTVATLSACSQPTRSGPPGLHAGGAPAGEAPAGETRLAMDPNDSRSFSELIAGLTGKRVVFVGESHDRYDHHLNQLAIIRGLREGGVDLALGMEFFQEPFQSHLDRYLAGEIDEKAMLKRTEYYDRWKYDYRLYRDILTYAREHRIPLVALNAPAEFVAQVSKAGLDGLPPQDRARLPADMSTAAAGYEARLRPIFEMHGKVSDERFRRFVDVQTLWDEHMARVARDYLQANPGKTMVILAGAGHVVYPDAMPGRLGRMVRGEQAVVATGSAERYAGGEIDFLLAERDVDLPPPGRMGLMLAGEENGVTVSGVSPASPAANAGFRPGDRVLSIAGERIRGMDDVKLALLDRAPGEEVWVEVGRGGTAARAKRHGRALTLL